MALDAITPPNLGCTNCQFASRHNSESFTFKVQNSLGSHYPTDCLLPYENTLVPRTSGKVLQCIPLASKLQFVRTHEGVVVLSNSSFYIELPLMLGPIVWGGLFLVKFFFVFSVLLW